MLSSPRSRRRRGRRVRADRRGIGRAPSPPHRRRAGPRAVAALRRGPAQQRRGRRAADARRAPGAAPGGPRGRRARAPHANGKLRPTRRRSRSSRTASSSSRATRTTASRSRSRTPTWPSSCASSAQLTGKRFIFGGKVRNIKATVYSPQKVTVAEAYQAFLSILETNGLTVVPHGRFLKIVETAGVATQDTPIYGAGQGAPDEDRYITRMHRLAHMSADDVANVLGKFKTKDGDITVYGPGNLLIITDTGTNIRRMMQHRRGHRRRRRGRSDLDRADALRERRPTSRAASTSSST